MVDASGALLRMLDAYYSGTDEVKELWANTLAKLSQGWPQHINCVGVEAGMVLRSNEGRMERNLLELALEKGNEGKNDYYAERLASGTLDPEFYKQIALESARHPNGVLPRKELRRLIMPAYQNSQESFNELLANALRAGLLAPVTTFPHHYQIPIPSLDDYLRALPV